MEIIYEIPFDSLSQKIENKTYVRLNLLEPNTIEKFITLNNFLLVPVLYYPAVEIQHEAFLEDLVDTHIACSKKLIEYGFKVVLAVDEDGALMHTLSANAGRCDIQLRMYHLVKIIKNLPSDQLILSLCLEELCPGGLDPFDGVFIARKMQEMSVKKIIASSGTKRFPLLYERKKTKEKEAKPLTQTVDPVFGVIPWLREHVTLELGLGLRREVSRYDISIAKKFSLSELVVRL